MSVPDRSLDPIARRQHGAFNLDQARQAGFTKSAVENRVRTQAWDRKARGVFTLRSARPTWKQRLMVAALSKSEAAVFGLTVCALHELPGFPRGRPEIVVPRWVNHRSELAKVHRRNSIDRTVVDRIPAVTLLQTLFDVAGSVPPKLLMHAAEHSVRNGLVRRDQLADRFLALAPSVPPGIGEMRKVVETLCDTGFVPAESVLEVLLFELLDELGLEYERQARCSWRGRTPMIVDALVPALNLVVEADGRSWHARLAAFETDRLRDNAATAHGLGTMRFTYTMLTTGRATSRASLQTAIARQSSGTGPRLEVVRRAG